MPGRGCRPMIARSALERSPSSFPAADGTSFATICRPTDRSDGGRRLATVITQFGQPESSSNHFLRLITAFGSEGRYATMSGTSMRYHVLDTETVNLYGRFQSEEAAFAFTRALIAAYGPDILESLALGGW